MLDFKKHSLSIFIIILILLIMPITFAANDASADAIAIGDNSNDINDIEVSEENNDLTANGNPQTIYVDSEGDDNNNGTENSPVKSISKAIEIANAKNNSEIIINNGTYKEYNLKVTITE